jgi:hypothetical protein
VTNITFQNASGYGMLVKGTTDATTPTDDDGAIIYPPIWGEANRALSEIFLGSGFVRVWVYIEAGNGRVVVHHA